MYTYYSIFAMKFGMQFETLKYFLRKIAFLVDSLLWLRFFPFFLFFFRCLAFFGLLHQWIKATIFTISPLDWLVKNEADFHPNVKRRRQFPFTRILLLDFSSFCTCLPDTLMRSIFFRAIREFTVQFVSVFKMFR